MRNDDLDGERQRLEALDATQLLDTPADPVLDGIVDIARTLYAVPIALISLVDRDRQWFKACVGLPVRETPREVAFCSHAIREDDYLLVTDAAADPRFSENPLVVGEPRIRFYAGIPLRVSSGHALGTLCIIDRSPRVMSAEQLAPLRTLARQIEVHLELRLQLRRVRALEARERALNEESMSSAAELAQLLDGLSDFVVRTDARGTVTYANRAVRETLGYAQPVGMSFVDLVARENHAASASRLARFAEGARSLPLSNVLVAADGRRLIVEGTVFSERAADGALLGLRAIFRDVTTQRVQEARLGALVEGLGAGVLVETADRRVAIENALFAQMFGGEEARLGASAARVMEHVATLTDDPAAFLRRVDSVIQSSAPVQSEEICVTDGRVFERDYSPLTIKGSTTNEHLWVFRDVTPRRELERMKNEFVTNVSHEFRTPLTSIRGVIGLLARGGIADLPEDARSLLAVADAETERLSRLVNEILDVDGAKHAAPKSAQAESAAALLASAVDATAPLAAEAAVRVTVTVPQECTCVADRDRTIQVLINLLGNAIKFSPPAGAIELTAFESGDMIRFVVRDHGPGISPVDIPTLFTRFRQLAVGTIKPKGTGLGLAISKALVEQQGGRIGVASTLAAGSEFYFELPRAHAG